MHLLTKSKVPPSKNAWHRISRPPATVLNPFAAEVRLEGDRDRDALVTSLADQVGYETARSLRDSFVRIQEPQPFVSSFGNGDVAGRVEIGDQRMTQDLC